MWPGTDQIKAISEVPVLILTMVVVLVTLLMLAPVIRGLFTRQNSHDKNTEAITNMLVRSAEQVGELTDALKAQADTNRLLGTTLVRSIAELPAAIGTGVLPTFLDSSKAYTDTQTKLITYSFKLSADQATVEREALRVAFTKRLDELDEAHKKTMAAVQDAFNRMPGAIADAIEREPK